MSELKDRSYIGTALKHHSKAQSAIKLLQEQLECLDRIRQSSRTSFVLSDEKGFEKSASDLLLSTSRILVDPSPGKLQVPDALSSTLDKCEKLKGPTVIRNLLPTFDHLKDPKPLFINDVSPIKASGFDRLTPRTKDSLASTTLPLTPFSIGLSLSNSMHSSPASKSMPPSPSKLTLPPTSMDLTEALAKLSYGSMVSRSTDDMANSSDELFHLLEKISGTAEHLRNELNDARTKESKLIEELERLRSTKNSSSPRPSPLALPSSPRGNRELEAKCFKLEDALLSLQDENMKLNRLLKDQETNSSDKNDEAVKKLEKALVACEKDNMNLNTKIQGMKAQLEFYEKLFGRQNNSITDSRLSIDDLRSNVAISQCNKSESVGRLEEKVLRLEGELHHALTGMGDSKDLQTQINLLHRSLLEKDNRIKQSESAIHDAVAKKEEIEKRFEDLQKQDVYKRKEVVQLCDKFEKMKAKYKKLESDFVAVRAKDQAETTKKWAMQDSLHKLFKENEALQNKLISEQRQLAMSKLLLEKDYNVLKKRYDDLLVKVGECEGMGQLRGGRAAPFYGGTSSVGWKPPARQENVAIQFDSPPQQQKRPRMKSTATEIYPRPKSANDVRTRHSPHDFTYQDPQRSLHGELSHQGRYTSPPVVPPHYRPSRSRSTEHRMRLDDPPMAAIATSTPKQSKTAMRINLTPHPCNVAPAPERPPSESVTQDGDARLVARVEENIKLHRTMSSHHASPPRCTGRHLAAGGRSLEDSSQLASKTSPVRSASMTVLESPKTKAVYEEDYIRNMKTVDKSTSSPDQVIEGASLRKLSTLHAPQTKPKLPRQRRGIHTTPIGILNHVKGIQFVSEDGIAYGESPYSKEYLSNMDGVRLVANLSHSSDSNDNQLPKGKVLSPIKSILKSSSGTSGNRSFTLVSQSAPDLSKVQNLENVEDKLRISTKSDLRSSSCPSYNTKASFSASAPDSRASDRSFHLSDLPSDQTAVYDRFRNFDSHVNGYKAAASPVQDPEDSPKEGRPGPDEGDMARKKEADKAIARRAVAGEVVLRGEEDMESVGQSSSSTTRDHAGRIEFLREMQINTGVRMPALMRDVTMRSDVQVGDEDLAAEVRIGLSDNQEEYADKLVKKYTKNSKKVLV